MPTLQKEASHYNWEILTPGEKGEKERKLMRNVSDEAGPVRLWSSKDKS